MQGRKTGPLTLPPLLPYPCTLPHAGSPCKPHDSRRHSRHARLSRARSLLCVQSSLFGAQPISLSLTGQTGCTRTARPLNGDLGPRGQPTRHTRPGPPAPTQPCECHAWTLTTTGEGDHRMCSCVHHHPPPWPARLTAGGREGGHPRIQPQLFFGFWVKGGLGVYCDGGRGRVRESRTNTAIKAVCTLGRRGGFRGRKTPRPEGVPPL
jgi:hypothetical protein